MRRSLARPFPALLGEERIASVLALLLCLLAGCNSQDKNPIENSDHPTDDDDDVGADDDDSSAESFPAPIHPWVDVAAGSCVTCGLRKNGRVTCWGFGASSFNAPPVNLQAKDISTLTGPICALRDDKTVVCWHNENPVPAGEFAQISAGAELTCGVRLDNSVVCWGNELEGGAIDQLPSDISASKVASGLYHACALTHEGEIQCWGLHWYTDDVPTGTFKDIVAGMTDTCALDSSGNIKCWGLNSDGQLSHPMGQYASISAGVFFHCALTSYGIATCWGNDENGGEILAAPESERFRLVDSGADHSCGITLDNRIVCWGNNAYGQCTPPSEY